MLFSSLEFLYLFLPITLICYFVSPFGARNYILLAASLVFYGIAQPRLLPLMIGVSLLDFLFGLAVMKSVQRGRERCANILCSACVALNVLTLFVFKYLDVLLGAVFGVTLGIELPTGISFYTFQAMSYVIDIRRRAARIPKNPLLFLTYVSLFPQLVAGPIVRYCEIDGELEHRTHTVSRCADGVRLFAVGLCKKLIFANGAGECWERMVRYSQNGLGSVIGAWLGLVFFAFQIYYDFSGYSDMARGLGRIFGFEFPENFNYPYISRSITEFWRRWHITLSSWFREYVYIPLGGNRRGRGRMYLNLLAVWLLTGIWHGAGVNFILWGLYFFVLLAIEKAFLLRVLKRVPSVLSHTYALIFILLGWLIFACDGTLSLSSGTVYFGELFGVGCPFYVNDALFEMWRNLPYIALMALGCTPLPASLFQHRHKHSPVFVRSLCNVLTVAALVICTAYLADSGYNPFLYFKF